MIYRSFLFLLAAASAVASSFSLHVCSEQAEGASSGPFFVQPGTALRIGIYAETSLEIGGLKYELQMPTDNWVLQQRSYSAYGWDWENDDNSIPTEDATDVVVSAALYPFGAADAFDFALDTSVESTQLVQTGAFVVETVVLVVPELAPGLYRIAPANVTLRDENGLTLAATIVVQGMTVRVVSGNTLQSSVAGDQRTTLPDQQTRAISNPFLPVSENNAAHELADQLAQFAIDGDFLHVWVGTHFNRYTREQGQWQIYDSDAQVPSERLTTGPAAGYLLRGSSRAITFAGTVQDQAVAISLIPETWSLLANPFPAHLDFQQTDLDGAEDGDQLRSWNVQSQSWTVHSRTGGVWSPQISTISAGIPFLYCKGQGNSEKLTFSPSGS